MPLFIIIIERLMIGYSWPRSIQVISHWFTVNLASNLQWKAVLNEKIVILKMLFVGAVYCVVHASSYEYIVFGTMKL